jgi:oxygen-dependent protoporphyrinogen oxidase
VEINDKYIHIIGAGITGLGAAQFLSNHGINSTLYECEDKIGGRAGCIEKDGYVLEVGGKNFSSGWSEFNDLLKEFNIKAYDKQHPNFHIILNGKLIELNKQRTLTGDISLAKALGLRGAFQLKKLMAEAFKNHHKLERSGSHIAFYEKRYDHKPISSLFTRKLAYGPLRMFSIISGAAEPDEVYYSNILAFMAGFAKGSHHAISGGIGRLLDSLAQEKNILFNTEVNRIKIEKGVVTGLSVKTPKGSIEIPASHVISTLPLHALKKLIDFPEKIKQEIESARYYPVILINAIYDNDIFNENVNSIMFDETFHLGHCSANRMYQKNHVRFTLSGRKSRKIMGLSDNELIDIAEKEFDSVLPINANRVFYHVARHPGGICAYAPNYSKVRKALLGYASTINGLEIAGDYLEGHSMGECLKSSRNAVDKILQIR